MSLQRRRYLIMRGWMIMVAGGSQIPSEGHLPILHTAPDSTCNVTPTPFYPLTEAMTPTCITHRTPQNLFTAVIKSEMDIGVVKIAEDKDFEKLKKLYDDNNDWRLDYNKPDLSVWTKSVPGISFRMVKIRTRFSDVQPETLYDVLHDPEYRKVWDTHMIESKDIGFFNPNNDIGYYSMSCTSPLKNRDFVLQRSWLDTGREQLILNHSVYHKDYPPRKSYVRATSYLTGYIVRPSRNGDGTELGYVSHTDPHGKLPVWLVNKVTQIFAPKMVKKLHKAAIAYPSWKKQNNPNCRPWHYPEQIMAPRIRIEECIKSVEEKNMKNSYVDESDLKDSIAKDMMIMDSD